MSIPDPTRYIARNIPLSSSILKEVPTTRKKEIVSYFDKLNTIIIDFGSETILAGYEWSEGP